MASVGREEDHLVLWRLYVLPEHHGQGIGSALLAAVLEEARRKLPARSGSPTPRATPRPRTSTAPGVSSRPHHEAGGGGVPDQVWMTRPLPQQHPDVPAASDTAPATAPADTEGVQ